MLITDSNEKATLNNNEMAGIVVNFIDGSTFAADASVTCAALGFGINSQSNTTFAVKSMGAGGGFKIDRVAFDVPEPSKLDLLGLGIMGLASRRFKK